MPEKGDPIAAALNRIADELKRFNDAQEPKQHKASEAEVFRANYDREDPEKRELADFLRGVKPKIIEAANSLGRASSVKDGRSKKASRRGRGSEK